MFDVTLFLILLALNDDKLIEGQENLGEISRKVAGLFQKDKAIEKQLKEIYEISEYKTVASGTKKN